MLFDVVEVVDDGVDLRPGGGLVEDDSEGVVVLRESENFHVEFGWDAYVRV